VTLSTFDPPLNRTAPSRTVLLIGITVATFLLWAAFAWVEEIVRAPGQIVPKAIRSRPGRCWAACTVRSIRRRWMT